MSMKVITLMIAVLSIVAGLISIEKSDPSTLSNYREIKTNHFHLAVLVDFD
jgi:hypothetical protein